MMQGKADAINGPVWSIGYFSVVGGANVFPYPDYGVQIVGYGIVAHVETIKTRPDLVQRFVEVTLRAWNYVRENPDEALAAFFKTLPDRAKTEAIERERANLEIALKLVQPAIPGMPLGVQSEGDWERMQRQLIEYGAIKEARPVGQYLTNRFVR